jgi:hypothetical protein
VDFLVVRDRKPWFLMEAKLGYCEPGPKTIGRRVRAGAGYLGRGLADDFRGFNAAGDGVAFQTSTRRPSTRRNAEVL